MASTASRKEKKQRRNAIAMQRTSKSRPSSNEPPLDPKRHLKSGTCGSKTRSGGRCKMKAGFRTDHPGFGNCYLHGGFLPAQVLNAQKNKAILMGAPKEINPVDALYWCIKITAGEVEWLSEQITELDKRDWVEDTVLGKQMHLFVRERKEAVERLAGFAKVALSLGLAERAVRLAENYGIALSKLLKGVLDDLDLDERQQKLAPLVVRKHLVLLEGGNPISQKEKMSLKELEKETGKAQ